MSLIDRVLAEPELASAPPVLVDVGAAGGVPRVWRRIARHCVVLAFEPDAREAQPLTRDQQRFKRFVFCPAIAVAAPPRGGVADLHLTASPQCSSVLLPNEAGLSEWSFARRFAVTATQAVPARQLTEALAAEGLAQLDWLKCDTQGTDLRLFQSLPATLRERLIVAEFEPGLIDAYVGEDKAAEVLRAMDGEPFWLSELVPNRVPRARPEQLEAALGRGAVRWAQRLAPAAPAWLNLRFLRDAARRPDVLDCRAYLLTWAFAMLTGQPGYALSVAQRGEERFGDARFVALRRNAERRLRLDMLLRLPSWLAGRVWERLGG